MINFTKKLAIAVSLVVIYSGQFVAIASDSANETDGIGNSLQQVGV